MKSVCRADAGVHTGGETAHLPGQDDLRVPQCERCVSLDGVDWNDPERHSKLYHGQAMRDFVRMKEEGAGPEPTRKEEIPRVPGSMALKMADHNYIALPQTLASAGSPVVINNACGSWHRLASIFMFANPRAYIGTLFSVLDPEAQAVVERLFGKYFDKPLSVALWRAENDVAGDGVRRPYVMVGCHFQRLRAKHLDNLGYVIDQLTSARADWQGRLATAVGLSKHAQRTIEETVKYLDEQLAGMRRYRTSPRGE